jgi:redox-sensitive bicupin YhaK (pirin superfamily)
MINIRKAQDRGLTQTDWLKSFHTFSFADYYDPAFMGFADLRVINEDTINAAEGFGTHPHNNMEIITYVVAGSLEHKDSMGTGSTIKPGEIQRMSAGTGITHSEFNHSKNDALHLLQIWILPNQKQLKPEYEQKPIHKKINEFILIGSNNPTENAVTIHQDVQLYVAYLSRDAVLTHNFKTDRNGWLQLIKGKIDINGQIISAGDGVAIVAENQIKIHCLEDAELLLFDLIK